MKKFILLALSLATLSNITEAQYRRGGGTKYLEIGVAGGVTNYWGDLSKGPFGPGTIGINGGGFLRYNIGEKFSARFHIQIGEIMADAKNSSDAAIKANNLSFKSNIVEYGVIGEYNILGYAPDGLVKRFSPYVFAGLTGCSFTPQAQDAQGNWVDLQPLGTEGQNVLSQATFNGTDGRAYPLPLPYSTTTLAIPLGIGVKFAISSEINIGAEIGARLTMTDYLDDVGGLYAPLNLVNQNAGSQGIMAEYFADRRPMGSPRTTGTPRATVKGNDWYLMGNITLSYNILNGFGSTSKRGCPTF